MTNLQAPAALTGRILLALMFIVSGATKISSFEATMQYMEVFGVPGTLLPLVIIAEIGGGLLVATGLFTRYAAIALAGFTLIAGAVFHSNFADQIESVMFMKNLTIAGGLLVLAAFGPGGLSLDARRGVLMPAAA